MYSGIYLDELSEIFSAITGWDIDGKEMLKVGERVFNLQRMFNVREGFRRGDDMIPKRVMRKPAFGLYVDEERCAIKDFDGMLDEYYEARGWDIKTGVPSQKKLQDLGVDV